MLSRAQEARVREVLANHPPGMIQTYCLEHLAAAAKIPPGHLADLAVFVRGLREHGACQTQYGGMCDADAHETDRVLIWGPPTLMAKRPPEPNMGGSCSMSAPPPVPGETTPSLDPARVRAWRAGSGQRLPS